jgi:pimeloyl-ACP methyl ester carboxylesterase
MGGEVSVALAERNPQRVERMVLIDSPPLPDTTFSMMTRLYMQPVVGELLSRFETDRALRRELEQGFAPGFAVPDAFVGDLKQVTYTAARSAHEASIAYRQGKAPYERLAALQPAPPLLVIFGSRDAIIPSNTANLFEHVPGARVELIEGVGHSPMVEAPEKTLELIQGFLAP